MKNYRMKTTKRKDLFYQEYMSDDEVERGIKDGTLFEGEFFKNPNYD